MKEKTLREMIRKQIKSSLTEAPDRIEKGLGKIEKMASVKMLKRSLGQGTPAQQASGLLKVVQAISGDNPATGKMLARMLMKGGISTPDAAPEPVEEGALDNRQARVDKTQAFQMLKKTLGSRPSTQQVDFVIKFINDLGLKASAKKRLMIQLRKGLE